MAIKTIKYNNNKFLINYDIVNNDKENIIIFLHGWGSNKEIMKQAFSKKLRGFKHIYIDMPGFGRSVNDVILNTQDYANIMDKFNLAMDIDSSTITVLGHSFGGKVATLLNPKNLILCSSAGILETKSAKTLLTIRMAKVFNRFGLGKVTKMLRSKDVDKMSQNMYETFKNVVDEDFSQSFKEFKNNTLIFWGNQDEATTLESGKTINTLISNSSFKSYDGDHYFFIKHSDDICDIIKNKIK
ncbi:MAG: alpha/beta fold hydrolase [Campylobacterota bacterium]|nr:alpha/beta fold hydrolase [Campylobacterota bacterium]